MEPAESAALAVRRQVALHEAREQPMLCELVFAKGAGEEPTSILTPFQVDDTDT
jgi:hypothetical protein